MPDRGSMKVGRQHDTSRSFKGTGMHESPRGHETFEHTADMGLMGWGPDEKSAICETAMALFELMRGGETPEPDKVFDLEIEGYSLRELLVELLNRLISLADLNEAGLVDIESVSLESGSAGFRMIVKVRAAGLDRSGGRKGSEVKAVAGYGADVRRRTDGAWVASCVVDL